jgi:hypothetical protein
VSALGLENWRGPTRSSVSKPAISYTPRLDTTPEAELGALSAVYAFILQKHRERQKATLPGGPEDGRKDRDAATQPHCT